MKNCIYPFSILLFLLVAISCSEKNKEADKAKQIIDKCIEVHGGENYHHFDVSFDFRKFNVRLKQDGGNFLYERSTYDSANNPQVDRLTNEGLTREINGIKQTLTEKEFDKYHEGINSIAYFVLLPYKLSEPAAILTYVGEVKIDNKNYDKIAVSFLKEGGGKDHHDEFCYWINQSTHTLDYLSYASGGPRFREATKREVVNGITFQDYNNYEIPDSTISPNDYDKAFISGKAKLLSKIEQTNYKSR